MKFDTDYPADSVEFCPTSGLEDFFVCGTYKLIQEDPSEVRAVTESEDSANVLSSRKRVGKCILFKVQEGQDDETIEVVQEINMPAILDMKWSYSSSMLAIADSEGRVSIRKLDSNEQLQDIQTIQCRPVDTLCLSLDWSNRLDTNRAGCIVVSCSDGSLSLLRSDGSGTLSESQAWHAHDFEAWIAAWDYWNTNVIYSGGDDLTLKGWDIRQDASSSTFINKSFDAGVTSIQCHPHNENILAVGSYDETVRIFDTRKPLVAVMQAEVGGGAWRVKWHPRPARSTDLLVACMHDGFKIVRFSPSVVASNAATHDTGHEWEIISRFDAHESLAYGVDWAHRRNETTGDTLIASCSFYDHAIHTWKG